MRAGAVAAALVGAALVLSGCQYLLGPLVGPGPIYPLDPGFGSFDPNEPGFSLPPPEATFTEGSADITIDGTALHLDRLSGNATMHKEFGTDVVWTDGDGNYVHYFGGGSGGLGLPGFLSMDRIADGKHLGTINPINCAITVDKSDATGLSGSATCKNLQWVDMVSSFSEYAGPSGGPPFDAEITFEATP